MGASESAEPRHVSIERGDAQKIVVTEDVIRRLEGKEPLRNESNDDLEEAYLQLEEERRKLQSQRDRMKELLQRAFEEGRKKEATRIKGDNDDAGKDHLTEKKLQKYVEEKEKELRETENNFKEQLEAVERKYSDQSRATEEQFNSAVEEVQRKFRHRHTAPVCQSIQNNIFDCYTKNPKNPLRCSRQVQEFADCVNQSGLEALKATR